MQTYRYHLVLKYVKKSTRHIVWTNLTGVFVKRPSSSTPASASTENGDCRCVIIRCALNNYSRNDATRHREINFSLFHRTCFLQSLFEQSIVNNLTETGCPICRQGVLLDLFFFCLCFCWNLRRFFSRQTRTLFVEVGCPPRLKLVPLLLQPQVVAFVKAYPFPFLPNILPVHECKEDYLIS